MRTSLLLAAAALVLTGSGVAFTKDKAAPPAPQAYKDLVQCKEITDSAARLACFDERVGKLEQAAASGELVVSDRATVKEAQRGLFGFKLPSLKLFGGGDDDKDEIKSIDGVIATARTFGYGAWRITLQDGSVWEQIDDERPVFDPVKGDRVKVYKAALGTYKMNISSQRAIKVRRVE